ncbi:MAG TPA: choice-of-anchor tandem repeat GloVer-containing protein [Terriglobales bacterium]|jgi:uncharacterized repeat protein (TIGR03803 family)
MFPKVVSRKRIFLPISLLATIAVSVFLSPLAGAQTYTVLHHFDQTNGPSPLPQPLFLDSHGTLYGSTKYGGTGGGTVYKLEQNRTFTTLYSFPGWSDDCFYPSSAVTVDPSGNIYGPALAWEPGYGGGGAIFKIDPSGVETIMHHFLFLGVNGENPTTSLIPDKHGFLLGTTAGGGTSGYGVIYRINPSNGAGGVIYNFSGPDGNFPGAIVKGAGGTLYGSTIVGGAFDVGTIYKIDSQLKQTVLYSFTGGPDGGYPNSGIALDSQGNIFGTTDSGGANDAGTVFKVSPDGTETVLHDFSYFSTDGLRPAAGVAIDKAGNVYGTTEYGGTLNGGILFGVDASGTFTILHNFDEIGGINPITTLMVDADGTIFGTTSLGGLHGSGVAFRLRP